MKKHLFILLSACLLWACGKDEPESTNDGNGDSGSQVSFLDNAVFTTNDGDKVVLSSIDSWYKYTYDKRGYVISTDEIVINYDKMVMYEDGSTTASASFTLNNQGLIASISTINSKKYTFSYDSSGHLTAWSIKYYDDTATGSIVWEDDKIIKVSYKYFYYSDELGHYHSGVVTTIPNYKEPNKLKQYTISFYDLIIRWDDYTEFALVGLLGKPCSYLPSSLYTTTDETWTDDEGTHKIKRNYHDDYDYSFNDNGTIAFEYDDIDGDREAYKYSYRPFNPQSRSMTETSDLFSNMSKETKARKHSIKDRINSRHNRIRK